MVGKIFEYKKEMFGVFDPLGKSGGVKMKKIEIPIEKSNFKKNILEKLGFEKFKEFFGKETEGEGIFYELFILKKQKSN